MDSIEGKSLDKPDERREFSNGVAEMVTIGDVMIGRAVFQPGWRWSNDVKPIAQTDRCMILHQGYVVQGSLGVQAEDGTEKTLNPGEAYVIQPGHEAWVVGDETVHRYRLLATDGGVREAPQLNATLGSSSGHERAVRA